MEEEIKVKNAPITIVCKMIVWIMVLITIGLFGWMFVKPADAIEATEYYTNEESVKQSKAYNYAVSAVSSIKKETEIDEVQKLTWIYIWNEEFEKLSVYVRVKYTSKGESNVKCYSYIKKKYREFYQESYKTVELEIEESEYKKQRAYWIYLENKEDAAWAKEKSYNEYAISIIVKEAK